MIFLSLTLVIPLYSFSGGTGSSGTPYIISTCVELENISFSDSNLNSNYILNNNLDCSSILNFKPIGGGPCDGECNLFGGSIDKPFIGDFNGNNLEISNIEIFNYTTTDDGWGLFGYIVSPGHIYNLSLKYVNVNISDGNSVGGLVGNNKGSISNTMTISNILGESIVGGLVGNNYGNISNSYSISTVSGNSFVGGLVGSNTYGNILNSYSISTVFGDTELGGLVGDTYQGDISNSYSVSDITGTGLIGGLVGFNAGDISNSYSISNISGTITLGGLIGYQYSGVITNSYWLNTSNNLNVSIGDFIGGSLDIYTSTNLNYFYDTLNSPIDLWDTSIWNFTGTGLAGHVWDVPVTPPSTPTPSSGVSVSGLPSFGVSSVFVVFGLILIFLF
ncbi:MAG: hypothetical protein HRU03_06355 [Nanoarchaeales archaeon]|nr:hypothetical protein [Nanoarchaeales archaeon]